MPYPGPYTGRENPPGRTRHRKLRASGGDPAGGRNTVDFTPHTDDDVRAMLETIGVGGIDDLFEGVPDSVRLDRRLDVPPPMAEAEVLGLMEALARENRPAGDLVCFAGGGAYDHYVPAPVRHLAFRSEFAIRVGYTPACRGAIHKGGSPGPSREVDHA